MKAPGTGDIARAAQQAAPATPEHRRFQTLLTKIDAARQTLADWQQQLPLFAAAHQARIAPLAAALRQQQRDWAFALEQLVLQPKRWSRSEQRTLARLIVELCGGLIERADGGDAAEIQALHDRHADTDWDTGQQQQLQAMKAMFEHVGGFDLGDAPIADADDLMRRAAQAQGAADAPPADAPPPRRKAKTARERRAEDDALRVSQTVREVYRKLAAVLHPDRIGPDATPKQRAERTEQMARANGAYERGDLLALLTLQLQIEQIDIAHAAGIAAGQVRHFNAVLAEQLRELQAEIDDREQQFCAGYGLMPERRLNPLKLLPVLNDTQRELLAAQQMLDRDRRMLLGGVPQARAWLRRIAAEQRADDADDLLR